jgi:hypothetical protein
MQILIIKVRVNSVVTCTQASTSFWQPLLDLLLGFSPLDWPLRGRLHPLPPVVVNPSRYL